MEIINQESFEISNENFLELHAPPSPGSSGDETELISLGVRATLAYQEVKKKLKTLESELDVMIKEPENYEIYKLIFEIINPNQIRAISTDTSRNHSSTTC